MRTYIKSYPSQSNGRGCGIRYCVNKKGQIKKVYLSKGFYFDDDFCLKIMGCKHNKDVRPCDFAEQIPRQGEKGPMFIWEWNVGFGYLSLLMEEEL